MRTTLIVNGVTAWQMLHRRARVGPGQTILVHGANGGVGSILVQLARHAGVRVTGTASPRHHLALRALAVKPLDYRAPDFAADVRRLTPDGVRAAFNPLGLGSARRSFQLLAQGGTLAAYGMAEDLKSSRWMLGQFLALFSQMIVWNTLPDSRRAMVFPGRSP